MNKCLVVLSQQFTCNALCTMACRIRFLWIHRLVANLAVSTSLLDYGFALGVRLSHDNFDSLEIADSALYARPTCTRCGLGTIASEPSNLVGVVMSADSAYAYLHVGKVCNMMMGVRLSLC